MLLQNLFPCVEILWKHTVSALFWAKNSTEVVRFHKIWWNFSILHCVCSLLSKLNFIFWFNKSFIKKSTTIFAFLPCLKVIHENSFVKTSHVSSYLTRGKTLGYLTFLQNMFIFSAIRYRQDESRLEQGN